MATLDEIFSTENMNKLANNPLLAIGAQLMAQGQGSAASLGKGLSGGLQQVQQMQEAQQKTQYRNSLAQQQQAQLQAQQVKAQEAQQFKARLQDPAFVAQLPEQIRGFVQAGAAPEQIMDLWGKAQDLQAKQASLAQAQAYQQQRLGLTQQGQAQSAAQFQQRLAADQAQQGQTKAPTPSYNNQLALPDGKVQDQRYDAATGTYVNSGAPYDRRGPDPWASLLGGNTGPAVPDSAPGAAPANPAIDQTVNQLTPQAAAPAIVASGSLKNAGANAAPVQVTDAAGYAKVPSGAQYLTPDGVLKRKP